MHFEGLRFFQKNYAYLKDFSNYWSTGYVKTWINYSVTADEFDILVEQVIWFQETLNLIGH